MVYSVDFPEVNHPFIQPLLQLDDSTLVELLQSQPQKGKYLVTIFCRYHHKIIDLLTDFYSQEDIIIIALQLWEKIAHLLFNFEITNLAKEVNSLHVWLLDYTIDTLSTGELTISVGNSGNLDLRFFPLYFYTEKALSLLDDKQRLIIVLKDKFDWEDKQIISYFQGKNQFINHDDIMHCYEGAHHQIINYLPVDIYSIYLC
ncbi:MAG: hypothetical protein IGQ45_12450 [Cyanobacterium sp. T60_A2020_053]|nr:hypothetical protein [Cyanobacterium sp. T60_A2020_053]